MLFLSQLWLYKYYVSAYELTGNRTDNTTGPNQLSVDNNFASGGDHNLEKRPFDRKPRGFISSDGHRRSIQGVRKTTNEKKNITSCVNVYLLFACRTIPTATQTPLSISIVLPTYSARVGD